MIMLTMIYAVLFEIQKPAVAFGVNLFMIFACVILQLIFFSDTAHRRLAIILETYTMISQELELALYIWVFDLITEYPLCLKGWFGAHTFTALKHFVFASPSLLYKSQGNNIAMQIEN